MTTPRSSADYYRRQQRITARLITALRLVWRRMEPRGSWEQQYTDNGIGTQLATLVGAAQVAAAREADSYIAAVVVELGLMPEASPGVVVPSTFAGLAGDGRPVQSLMALSVPQAGRRFNEIRSTALRTDTEPAERPDEVSDLTWAAIRADQQAAARLREEAWQREQDTAAQAALDDTMRWIELSAATVLADTARAAESAATVSHREIDGYVRMLNLPSCARCAVLAGRFYRWNDGFERHPGCDCRHIPVSETAAGDLTVDSTAYFESLPTAQTLEARHPDLTVAQRRKQGLLSQEDIFTVDGARAIRDGADLTRVVNARRGMTTPAARLRPGARVMPETIYARAGDDRDEAIRLLQLAGFITTT
ncbi:hypothetical protein [Nocardioides bruguierae]|uniref:Uncharacterized protein n=1 Tax=Nocardioides bruguierae TaxID=2945102 RepID=A0A9X2DE07_9ACTN|nr:hypothetical protein [Nocardioides bruguierae]MCM0622709.1 hypothetical protein [Nocardioides bruguierae]